MREYLKNAIRGKGAFRKFKDGIRKIGLEQTWHVFQEDSYKRQAIRWCEKEEIEYE